MTSFMLLMSLYPDVQKLAQAGIDNVVGRDRLPSVNDRERMPYMSAFIKEVLRWAWTGPLGLSLPSFEIHDKNRLVDNPNRVQA